MKTCPECATPTAADAATCVVCGARFDQDAGGPGDGGEAAAQPDLSGRPDPEQPTVPQEPDMTTDLTDTTQTSDFTEPSDMTDSSDAPAAAQAPVAPPAEPGAADGTAVTPPSPSSGEQPSSAPDVAWPATQAGQQSAQQSAQQAGQQSGQQAGQQPPPVPPAAPPVPGALPLGESERNWGLLAHVSGLVASALVGMGFVGPLVVWLLKRDEHPFVAQNAAEALNFQLSMLLYGALLVVASLPVITLVVTLPLALVGFVLWVVLPIVAAVKASRGETWTYPITIGFVRP